MFFKKKRDKKTVERKAGNTEGHGSWRQRTEKNAK